MEPPVTMSRNQEATIPDEWRASLGLRYGATRRTPFVGRRREERPTKGIEPVPHWCRWRATPVLILVGKNADVGDRLLVFREAAARVMRGRPGILDHPIEPRLPPKNRPPHPLIAVSAVNS